MPLYLPTWPGPRRAMPRVISSKNEMTTATGAGPDTRVGRMGSRYAWDIVMPAMGNDEAQAWSDIDDEAATVVMEVLQPDIPLGSPGAPLVDGSAQSGSVLKLKGLTVGYVIRKGQWMSVITLGQRYLYRAAAAATVGGDTRVSVPIRTLLRRPPNNNDVVEIAQPMVEGYPTPAEDCWAIDANDRQVRLVFTIRERE